MQEHDIDLTDRKLTNFPLDNSRDANEMVLFGMIIHSSDDACSESYTPRD
ncbi:hypothetical protein PAXRUDRAFT_19722 [Paxillus rubicundulus Ve08.2h10]|uniref:Uncharacterized protein n=1 Tax=Paxillus rubicundulus Ve08.2h10 TaxID=930991 RepID=A0A0D0D3R1_9AGAM|nr:hypothetical protein PAXRUDRAFT_19722 [Paxillus rubicundulus Ve08.2h10]